MVCTVRPKDVCAFCVFSHSICCLLSDLGKGVRKSDIGDKELRKQGNVKLTAS